MRTFKKFTRDEAMAFFNSKKDKLLPTSILAVPMKLNCPNCKAVVEIDDTICDNCGHQPNG